MITLFDSMWLMPSARSFIARLGRDLFCSSSTICTGPTRVRYLSALANRVLTVAAVVGREFDFPLLRAALSDVDEEALLRAVDEGLKTLVIEPLPSRGAEWYQFTHALIRDAVYESISPSRFARIRRGERTSTSCLTKVRTVSARVIGAITTGWSRSNANTIRETCFG